MANIGYTNLGKARATQTKKVKTDDGRGTKLVVDGHIEGDMEVQINWDYIRNFMVPRALHAKTKRCKDGPLTVVAKNFKHIGSK